MRHRAVLASLAVLAAGAATAGILLDASAFASNALAEVAGLAVGVIVAVVLADYLIERRRSARWEKVAGATSGAIADRLLSMKLIVSELVLLDIDEDRTLLHEEDLEAGLTFIADRIRATAATGPALGI